METLYAAQEAVNAQNYAGAESLLRGVLEQDPENVHALNILGITLWANGRSAQLEEAVTVLQKALHLEENVQTLANLARVFDVQGKAEQSKPLYERMIELQPEEPGNYFKLGEMLSKAKHFTEAEQVYRRGISAVNNADKRARLACYLGCDLVEQRRMEEAESLFQESLHITTQQGGESNQANKGLLPILLQNLGSLYMEMRRPEDAAQMLSRLVNIPPPQGSHLSMYSRLCRSMCAWSGLEKYEYDLLKYCRGDHKTGNAMPWGMIASPVFTREDLRRAGFSRVQETCAQFIDRPPLVDSPARRQGRLRVGWLSPDMREHAVSLLTLRVLQQLAEKGEVEIFLYSTLDVRDDTQQKLQRLASSFRFVSNASDEVAAKQIAEDQLDILVDLGGFTYRARPSILAMRPAPIIVNWLGYPATLGHPRIADYIIGDSLVTPLEHATDYSETIAQLPHCYMPADEQMVVARADGKDRASMHLPAKGEGVVFGSFNQAIKITSQVFRLWCRILKQTPGSVLWLKEHLPVVQRNLCQVAQAEGVVAERLVFAPREARLVDHRSRLQHIDLALDTFPYNSHVTGLDALGAGVPLLTVLGDTFAGRVAASQLQTLGLPDLIARDEDEYLSRALELARNPLRLQELREKVCELTKNSPLFDSERFAHDLVALFRRMQDDYLAGVRQPIIQLGLDKASTHRSAPSPEIQQHEEVLKVAERSPEAIVWLEKGLEKQLAGEGGQALSIYRQALANGVKEAHIYNNMAVILFGQGKVNEAQQAAEKAVELAPDDYRLRGNYARLLRDDKQYAGAIEQYYLLIEQWLAGRICDGTGQPMQSADASDAIWRCIYFAGLLADWQKQKQLLPWVHDFIRRQSSLRAGPWTLVSLPEITRAELREAARLYAEEQWSDLLRSTPLSSRRKRKNENAPLRVGLLTADFYDHATMYLLIGVLESLYQNGELYLIAYVLNSEDDAWTQRARAACHQWRSLVEFSDQHAAWQIAADEVDILLDLKGYTKNARGGILARRPAPLLVNWLGFPGSMGHPRMADYIIGDPVVTPLDHADGYSETLAMLPHCYQPNDNRRKVGEPTTRAALGLPDDAFIFCCFNRYYKFTQQWFDLWCELLVEVPGSVLWMLKGEELAMQRLRQRAARLGVAPERLVFSRKINPPEHLARLSLADLALDTKECNSHTTASDALWSGVPILTCMGETFASRVAASLLHSIGLPELVTHTPQEYRDKALQLARSARQLEELRARLQRQKTTALLFNSDAFATDLTLLLKRMWHDHVDGKRLPIVIDTQTDAGTGNVQHEASDVIQQMLQQARQLRRADKLSEAEALCRQILSGDANCAPASHMLGRVLQQGGKYQQAEEVFRQSLRLRPDEHVEYDNLAILLLQQKRFAEAETLFARSLRMNPDNHRMLSNMALVLSSLGRMEESLELARKAHELAPYDLDICSGLANRLLNFSHNSDRVTEAEELYKSVIKNRPHDTEALSNLTVLYKRQNRLNELEDICHRLLALQPDNLGAILNMAKCLEENGEQRRALQWYDRALAEGNKRNMQGSSEFGKVLESKMTAQRKIAWWEGLDDLIKQCKEHLSYNQPSGMVPFALLSAEGFDRKELKQAASRYVEYRYAPLLNEPPLVEPGLSRSLSDRPLRIGYLSADWHFHPVSYVLAGVLEAQHKAGEVDVLLYGVHDNEDDMRRRVVKSCQRYTCLAYMTEQAAAARIADDEVDILVGLMGFTRNSRHMIQAYRPAPVLVNWLGYPGTMGNSRLADYIIGDPVATPLEHADGYSEKLALMPWCALPHDNQRIASAIPSRSSAGLPERGFVFCNFNQPAKMDRNRFRLWCRLLKEVPNSVLWLLNKDQYSMGIMKAEAQFNGVDDKRIIHAEYVPDIAEHLARLQLADLALDTFPYNSHVTANDALWMGVPLVTRCGDTFPGRVAASLLHVLNLQELVAQDDDEYFNTALSLARQPDRLKYLRKKLVAQRDQSPLFDTERFAKDLTRLLQRIWRDRQGSKHESFALTAS